MKFADVLAFAKAGWTPAQVKEMLELTETDPETKNKEVSPPVTENKNEDNEKSDFDKLIEKKNQGV